MKKTLLLLIPLLFNSCTKSGCTDVDALNYNSNSAHKWYTSSTPGTLGTNTMNLSSTGNLSIGNANNTYKLDVSGDINLTGSLRFSGTAITASAAEINILDGVTATTAELNKLDGVTATTAELNFLDITSAGTAQASKALILDSSSYINGINKIVFNAASTTRQVSSPGDYRCIDTNTITFNNAVTAASGTDTAHQVSNFIGRHTITATNTNVTTTNFSTFYIQGEPVNGTNMTITNKYALYINSGFKLYNIFVNPSGQRQYPL